MKKLIGILIFAVLIISVTTHRKPVIAQVVPTKPAIEFVVCKDKPVVWHDYICPTCHWYSGCTTSTYSECPLCESSLHILNCKPII
jgi:hypothetical protein